MEENFKKENLQDEYNSNFKNDEVERQQVEDNRNETELKPKEEQQSFQNNVVEVSSEKNTPISSTSKKPNNLVNSLLKRSNNSQKCLTASDIKFFKKGNIIFSNTLLLLIISIITFTYSFKLKKNNIFYKSKDLWIVFMLFVLSFYASSTNFSLKLVDNYTLSIYINQFMMFLLSIVFFYKIIKRQD